MPLVCDMSSDFMWRKVDVTRFALIYAGAQKNIGPSGVVVVIARKDFVAAGRKDIPKIFQYRALAENNSLYNTPPTFGIYLVRNVLSWLKGEGGLEDIEKRNREKARAACTRRSTRTRASIAAPSSRSSRSVMNVVFRLPTRGARGQVRCRGEEAARWSASRGTEPSGGFACRSTTR